MCFGAEQSHYYESESAQRATTSDSPISTVVDSINDRYSSDSLKIDSLVEAADASAALEAWAPMVVRLIFLPRRLEPNLGQLGVLKQFLSN